MVELIALLSVGWVIVLTLFAVVAAGVSGMLYRARRAARILAAADLSEQMEPAEPGVDTRTEGRAAA